MGKEKIHDLVRHFSFTKIFFMWLVLMLIFGCVFFLLDVYYAPVLVTYTGTAVTLQDALYFSFVTATTLGYGDIIPLGFGKLLTVVEVVVGLLIYGVVISKLVPRS